jgi:hypothetical protein
MVDAGNLGDLRLLAKCPDAYPDALPPRRTQPQASISCMELAPRNRTASGYGTRAFSRSL